MKHVLTAALLAATFSCSLAQAADTMKPGLWELSSEMSGSNMPAMPKLSDAQRKQMEAAGVKMPAAGGQGMGFSSKVCITPEQAKKGLPPDDPKQKCEQTDVKTSGKTTSWKIACSSPQKMTGSGSITYDSPEHYSGEATMQMAAGPNGSGPMSMQQKFKGQWLSASCK
ncbi:MAG TPA: DUF3617 domain-containing protein [Rhodocyclaceae bacterium]|jgi:hypothetical protein|nr:DUF3617 domain-containing protein [Rhodocyclaceae bacterium]